MKAIQGEKMKIIISYVEEERKHFPEIKVTRERKPELSSVGGGPLAEFESLLDRQLISTEFGYGGWRELKHEDVLNGVIEVIESRYKS